MKTFARVLLLVAAVSAEAPLGRQAAGQRTNDAPYPAAGFRPATAFELPSRQGLTPPATSYGAPLATYGAPQTEYGAPQTEYGAPQTEYGAPQTEYGAPVTEADDEAKQDVETIEGSGQKEEKERLEQEAEVVRAAGAYYVLLGDGRLQRVQYSTERDDRNMAYRARLRYAAEERAPLYVYAAAPQYQPAAYVQPL